jgi:tRNA(Ile)-lysidine synthase
LRACVIDHGLREASAEEAKRAAGFAAALGVNSDIVRLRWAEPGPRAQQAARAERYKALCAEARRHGARVIALAHTRDDQAETVLLRAGAGSSWRGLAGMSALAPAPLWPEGRALVVARPLLSARRADLREALCQRGADWIEDPSNSNTIFARVRARQRLAALEAEGLDPMRLAQLAEDLAPRIAALNAAAFALIGRSVAFDGGEAWLDLGAWQGDGETRRRALAVLIAAVSGEDREGAPQGLGDLEGALLGADFTGATLGGVRFKRERKASLMQRDKGAVLGRADGKAALAALKLPSGEEVVWDGRLALTAGEDGWSAKADAQGAPFLLRGEDRAALAEMDSVESRWLLQDHVAHRLGAFGV